MCASQAPVSVRAGTCVGERCVSAEVATASADILCQDLRHKLTGQRPADRYFRDVSKLADVIIGGGYDELAGIPRAEILMPYDNR